LLFEETIKNQGGYVKIIISTRYRLEMYEE